MSEKVGRWEIPEIGEDTFVLMRYPEPDPESLTTDERELIAEYVRSVATRSLAVRVKAATMGIQEVMNMRAQLRGEE